MSGLEEGGNVGLFLDPHFDFVRDDPRFHDPRFHDLLRRMNLMP